jgi:hypothetical protein
MKEYLDILTAGLQDCMTARPEDQNTINNGSSNNIKSYQTLSNKKTPNTKLVPAPVTSTQ